MISVTMATAPRTVSNFLTVTTTVIAMPFFSDKFKSPLSKKSHKQAFGFIDTPDDPSSNIQLNLQGYRAQFAGGKWKSDTNDGSGSMTNSIEELKRTVTLLKEENNLLKLKNEILLQMLVDEAAAEDI